MIEYDGKEYWPGLLERDTICMTEEQSDMFLRCVMMDLAGIQDSVREEMEKDAEKSMGYAILNKRLEVAECNVSFPTKLFVAGLCENPGEVVLWAYTLNLMDKLGDHAVITTAELAEKFPNGFPTEEEYDKAWDEQKQSEEPNGNKIDNFDNWPGVEV